MKNKYLIHKTVEIGKGVKIEEGTKIWHYSQVLDKAKIGKNCVIGHNCLIGKKVKIGNNVKIQSNTDVWTKVTLEDYVFIGPSVVFTNDLTPRSKYPKLENEWLPTRVREGATIGANATIVCGNTIGRWAFIGAGAVVVNNIPDYTIAVGVPAKVIGWICECGNELNFKKEKSICSKCKRKYFKKGERVREI
jgi:UDP-2-acetamido-3-amino-2,3-dideoxy-glucuronate N-acetyltransferase